MFWPSDFVYLVITDSSDCGIDEDCSFKMVSFAALEWLVENKFELVIPIVCYCTSNLVKLCTFYFNWYHRMQGSKVTKTHGVTECGRIRSRNFNNEQKEIRRTVDSD